MNKILCLMALLTMVGCSSTPNDAHAEYCQSKLNVLVENDVLDEVKNLVDRKCNTLVVKGWVKGRLDSPFDKKCKASYMYLEQRPALLKISKEFLMNSCYPENPDYFYWK